MDVPLNAFIKKNETHVIIFLKNNKAAILGVRYDDELLKLTIKLMFHLSGLSVAYD